MIKNDGDGARDLFLKAVASASKSKVESRGDVVLSVSGTNEYAEIKVCGTGGKGPFTVNQIRPAKFIPCIVLDKIHNQWWVLSPVVIVQEAAKKGRGQHGENPFECMNMRFPAFKKLANGPLKADQLQEAVEGAIAQGKPYETLRGSMQEVVAECAQLAAKHRDNLRSLITEAIEKKK